MLLQDSTLITSSNDGMICFFNYVKEEILTRFKQKGGKIFSFAYSIESKTLFMGSENENILKINVDELLQEAKMNMKLKAPAKKG